MENYPTITTCQECGIGDIPTRKYKRGDVLNPTYSEEIDICPFCFETLLGQDLSTRGFGMAIKQGFAVLLRELKKGDN